MWNSNFFLDRILSSSTIIFFYYLLSCSVHYSLWIITFITIQPVISQPCLPPSTFYQYRNTVLYLSPFPLTSELSAARSSPFRRHTMGGVGVPVTSHLISRLSPTRADTWFTSRALSSDTTDTPVNRDIEHVRRKILNEKKKWGGVSFKQKTK